MIRARLSPRNDPAGAGHFGAPRGDRTHKGQDYACTPGALVEAPVSGLISKIGYPYGSGYGGANQDLTQQYRYVEITDSIQRRHRVFYLHPHQFDIGKFVEMGTPIGIAQDVTQRYPQYPDMTPHIHYEIMMPDGSCVDPHELG